VIDDEPEWPSAIDATQTARPAGIQSQGSFRVLKHHHACNTSL
jgi:hypothetical protein